jgi:signal transduction histidine kinase
MANDAGKERMSTHEKVNILMVDDQPAKLLSYEAILAELGENLIKANSGKQALEILLRTEIAVVLMDVSMPELDGFELADMIQQHPRFQKVAIIFISAVHLTDLDRIRAYQRGAVDYISVPFNPELLRAKVSVFAELHRKAQQLEMLNQELRRLSASLIVAQDEERRRIAHDLHDGLGQDLVAAKLILDGLEGNHPSIKPPGQSITDARAIIDHVIQQVRSTSYLLHPPLLDEVGLRSALQWYLDGLSERSGIATSLDLQPNDFPRLAPEVERAVFRIIQEALTNVYRHARARRAWVSVVREPNRVTCAVCDDGIGVSDEVVKFRPRSIGVGIAGMRQRAKEFGGELQLRNTGAGSVLTVAIPISSSPPVAGASFSVPQVSNGFPVSEIPRGVIQGSEDQGNGDSRKTATRHQPTAEGNPASASGVSLPPDGSA